MSPTNRPFLSSSGPLFQNEGMEVIFHSHANKIHFHKKGCATSLILKVTVFRTRKWHIPLHGKHGLCYPAKASGFFGSSFSVCETRNMKRKNRMLSQAKPRLAPLNLCFVSFSFFGGGGGGGGGGGDLNLLMHYI